MQPRLAILCSQLRLEERLLLAACDQQGIVAEVLDDRKMVWAAAGAEVQPTPAYDVILIRSISHSRALSALQYFHQVQQPAVNTLEVATICGDKLRTTSALSKAGLASPTTHIAHTPQAALEAAERLGYPVIMKPATGSWGRLLAKFNDRAGAESIIEHFWMRGPEARTVYYLQKYIDKPHRDIRAFVVGGQTIAAVYRHSEHWVTNTARGAQTGNCPVTAEIDELCQRAARAVGGGVVAVDLLEDPAQGLLVNEVNDIMEFRNSITPTTVDIPAKIIDFALRVARDGWVAAHYPTGSSVTP
jgi:[lysine-biosynthesis-protein LysW]--L-2-aminoadipate ligase